MRTVFLLLLLLLLPACGSKSTEDIPEPLLYNFADSVTLIRTLIETKSVNKILEDDAKQEDIDFLLNNFSLSEIAFESEVLNCTLPVLVYYYEGKIRDQKILEDLVQKYKDRIKIVLLDVLQFPKIAYMDEVVAYPMIVMMNKRDIIARVPQVEFDKLNAVIQVFLAEIAAQ